MRIVGGEWKGVPIEAPEGRDVTRPTTDRVREALCSMLLSACDLSFENKSVLDAFAGSGALGLEMLSRKAMRCTFVDCDKGAVARVERNAKKLGAPSSTYTVLRGDVEKLAQENALFGAPFDIVLLDPPYATEAASVSAFVEKLAKQNLLNPGALVVYERSDLAPSLELEGFEMKKSKRYGKTAVDLFKEVCNANI